MFFSTTKNIILPEDVDILSSNIGFYAFWINRIHQFCNYCFYFDIFTVGDATEKNLLNADERRRTQMQIDEGRVYLNYG
jgi:hypothetical protein